MYSPNVAKFLISVVALTVIGALLRVQGIDRPITGDTAAMLLMHFPTSWDSLLLNYRDINQRTLYIFLAKLSMGVFGENEFAFRLPAFLAGILVLPLTHKMGVIITGSRVGAWMSTLLLTFSSPHLLHTQLARGYSLTVFLALTMVFIVYKLLDGINFRLWGTLFLLTGLGMILIVPSNIHFLAGVAVFYLIAILKNYGKVTSALGRLLKSTWPLIALFGVIGGYYLYILEDLQRAIVGSENQYKLFYGIADLSFSFQRFTEVIVSLISPWGTWLYLFLIFGLIRLYKTKGFILFVSLLVLPIIVVLLSGLLGPPRVYIYWLPFILILSGFGLAETIVWIKSRFSNPTAYCTGILVLAVIILSPLGTYSGILSHVFSKEDDFLDKFSGVTSDGRTTFKDAKAAAVFFDNSESRYDLIVIPYSDRVLRYYLEEHIAQNMLNILRGGRLDNIFFLGSSKVPPHDFPSVGGISATHLMQNHPFKLIHEFGNLLMYDFGLTIKKLSPSGPDRDYENNVQFKHDKAIKVEHVDQPKIAGSKALKVINPFSEGEAILVSKESGSIEVSKEESYILTNFARGYKESSQAALLHPKNKNPPGVILLNIFYGVFVSKNSKLVWKRIDPYKNWFVQPNEFEKEGAGFVWEIIFTIYPVTKGALDFSTGLRSANSVSHFDGFHSFILEEQNTGDLLDHASIGQ